MRPNFEVKLKRIKIKLSDAKSRWARGSGRKFEHKIESRSSQASADQAKIASDRIKIGKRVKTRQVSIRFTTQKIPQFV